MSNNNTGEVSKITQQSAAHTPEASREPANAANAASSTSASAANEALTHAHSFKGRLAIVSAAALALVVCVFAWAVAATSSSTSNVQYDKYAPVVIHQEIPKAQEYDTWLTLQFKDTSASTTYRQPVKIAAGSTSAEATVMLEVYKTYEISLVTDQSNWRFENETATYSNATTDGGNDTFSATSTTTKAGKETTKLKASLKIGTVDKPVKDRKITLTNTCESEYYVSDTKDVTNTINVRRILFDANAPEGVTAVIGSDANATTYWNKDLTPTGTYTVTADDVAPNPTNKTANSTWTFVGWATTPDASTADTLSAQDIIGTTISGTGIKYYAIWRQNSGGYWLATKDLTYDAEENYTSDTNYLNAAEIMRDIDVLANSKNPSYTNTKARWDTYLSDDNVHLYTTYDGGETEAAADGSTTSTKNKYVEFRVIEVSGSTSHALSSGGTDGSVVSFMATHTLPTAYQMRSDTSAASGNSNVGGWGSSTLRSELNSGSIYAKFNTQFKTAVQAVTKEYNAGGSGNSQTALTKKTIDKFWIPSFKEMMGTWSGEPTYAPTNEGTQYSYFAAQTMNAAAANTSLALTTRAGSVAGLHSTTADNKWWNRSPYTADAQYFCYIGDDGNPAHYALSYRNYAVSPCFSFGAQKTVDFDNKGHGNTISSQTLSAGSLVTVPTTSEVGTSAGLKFEGWYTDEKCSEDAKWDFNKNTITQSMTLYANWIPADNDEEGNLSYWISPAMKTTTGNTSATANQTNDDYVKEEWNVIKSAAEIQADIKQIVAEDKAGTLGREGTVSKEYQDMMTSDKYHLYTKYLGDTATYGSNGQDTTGTSDTTGLNKYMECRIIEVGEHKYDAAGNKDGSVLTFQAVHYLPQAIPVNTTSTNVGGWGASKLLEYMSSSANSMSIAANTNAGNVTISTPGLLNNTSSFNSAFTDALIDVTKAYNIGGGSSSVASSTISTASSKFWLPSFTEISTADSSNGYAPSASSEGEVYSWFKTIGVTGADTSTTNNSLIFNTRNGQIPKNNYNERSFLRIRSPQVTRSDYFMRLMNGVFSATEANRPFGIAPAFSFGEKETSEPYWLEAANTETANDAKKPGYESNIIETAAEIQEDMNKIRCGDADTISKWEDYMNNDNVHLYTRWSGDTKVYGGAADTTGKNSFVEFRIIQVGEHDSDSSAVTFMATHCLPTAYQVNSSTNNGGWGASPLRASMNTSSSGNIFNFFATDFTNDILSVQKNYRQGSDGSSVKDDILTTNDKLWLISFTELVSNITSISALTGHDFEKEGTQYSFWKSKNATANVANASIDFSITRSGSKAYTSDSSGCYYLRSAYPNTTGFNCVSNNGTLGNGYGVYHKLAIAPCFAFASTGVIFDTQGHGNAKFTKELASGKVSEPTESEYGTSTGLTLEGWYTDKACTEANKVTFPYTASANTTLYANWVPTANDEKGNLSYWISPSMTYVAEGKNVAAASNSASAMGNTRDSYVKEEWNVLKSSAEIQADLIKIEAGDADTIAEYTEIMTSDKYHLYTKYGTGSGSSKNDYLESRIIEVSQNGHALNSGESDNTTLSFMAVHSLPTAYAMKSDQTSSSYVNDGGWGKSSLRSEMNDSTGAIYSSFNSAFTSALNTTTKEYNPGGSSASTTTAALTSQDKLWLASYQELAGATSAASTTGAPTTEGTQYAWFAARTISTGTNAMFALKTRASGNPTSSSNAYYWWERSACAASTGKCFFYGNSTGQISIGTSSGASYRPYGIVPCFALSAAEETSEPYWLEAANTETANSASTPGLSKNVLKGADEIQADMKKIKQGDSSVISEWEGYMNNDNVHLYARYSGGSSVVQYGDTTSIKNAFVEFRVINVGSHDSDGAAVTFAATHTLPSAYAINSTDTNTGGWPTTTMYGLLNNSSGEIYSKFDTNFTSDIMKVKKKYNKGGADNTQTAEVGETSGDIFWFLSYSEIFAADATGYMAQAPKGEGSQYTWFAGKTAQAAASGDVGNSVLALKTRAGGATKSGQYGEQNNWNLRSPRVESSTSYMRITSKGNPGYADVATKLFSPELCFAFGSYKVSFNTGDSGVVYDDIFLETPGTVSRPATDPEYEGYTFDGWYTKDGSSTGDWGEEFNFDSTIASDVTIYAKFTSTAENNAYWLNVANAANPEVDVLKTQEEIQADIANILNGDATTIAEYTKYMNASGSLDSEVHLYTKLVDGANTTGNAKNDYAEFRLIAVGEHASDGSALTWQMTHVLPSAQAMNDTKTNTGGWTSSALRAKLQPKQGSTAAGEIYSMFSEAFTQEILGVSKVSNNGNKAAATASTTNIEKFWLLSAEEVYGNTAVSSGAVAGSEGEQYSYYAEKGITKGDSTNECLAYRTRSGDIPTGQETEYAGYHGGSSGTEKYVSWWLRSPSVVNEETFTRIYNDGRLDHNYATVKRGVALAFAMGGSLVTFNTQEHGNESYVKLASNIDELSTSQDEYGTSTGLTLEGWYDNAACSGTKVMEADGEKLITEKTTLYANWIPTENSAEGNLSYWIGPAMTYIANGQNVAAADNSASAMSNARDSYVKEEWNVLKSSAEIKADVAKIKAGDADTIAEYTEIMKSDKYHLYTKFNGDTATYGTGVNDTTGTADTTGLNDYMECRVINVGSHKYDGTNSDGTGLTFHAVHALPQAVPMNLNSADNTGGWTSSALFAYMNSSSETYSLTWGNTVNLTTKGLLANFNSSFTGALSKPIKQYNTGGGSSSALATGTATDASSVLWALSYTEVDALRNTSTTYNYMPTGDSEGETYQWFKYLSVDGTSKMNNIAYYTRNGKRPKNNFSSTTTYVFWWERSPQTNSTTNWLAVYTTTGLVSQKCSPSQGGAVAPAFAF